MSEDQLAEKRRWGPEVCLRRDPEILSTSSLRGFAGWEVSPCLVPRKKEVIVLQFGSSFYAAFPLSPGRSSQAAYSMGYAQEGVCVERQHCTGQDTVTLR